MLGAGLSADEVLMVHELHNITRGDLVVHSKKHRRFARELDRKLNCAFENYLGQLVKLVQPCIVCTRTSSGAS